MERVRAGLEALGIGGSDEQAERDRQLAEGSRLAEEQAARTDAERRGTEAAAQLRADMAQGRVDVFDASTGQVVPARVPATPARPAPDSPAPDSPGGSAGSPDQQRKKARPSPRSPPGAAPRPEAARRGVPPMPQLPATAEIA